MVMEEQEENVGEEGEEAGNFWRKEREGPTFNLTLTTCSAIREEKYGPFFMLKSCLDLHAISPVPVLRVSLHLSGPVFKGVLVCSGIYGVFGFSETIDVEKTIELIKMTSWMWLTAKDKTFSSSWIAWATDPVLCKKGNLL
ncbi:hypothetical protein GmHk_07G019127 [Glycine max]|nr:hypothetical protein GmHk_07G019127 [Glycine max]